MTKANPVAQADALRDPSTIGESDPRWRSFAIWDEKIADFRPRTLAEFHHSIDQITLVGAVPDLVRTQFETTKNLALYSWHVYRFQTVAETHAYATLEYALRERLGKQQETRATLRTLIKRALGHGLLRDNDIQHFRRQAKERAQDGLQPPHRDRQHRVKGLPDYMTDHRNELAHGGASLNNRATITLTLCADLINTIYAPGARRKAHP